MAVRIFKKFLDFEQVSVDSEMPILGQAPRRFDNTYHGRPCLPSPSPANPGKLEESQDKCLGGIFKSLMLKVLLHFFVFYDRKSGVRH